MRFRLARPRGAIDHAERTKLDSQDALAGVTPSAHGRVNRWLHSCVPESDRKERILRPVRCSRRRSSRVG
jgi:hypothetical protein